MMLDQQLLMSDAQALTATANSTDYIDAGAARNLGSGQRVALVVHVSAQGGTSPTIQAVFVGADDTAFSTNKITIADSGTKAAPGVGFIRMAIPAHTAKRYFRVEYTLGGTSPTYTVTAGIALNEPTTPMTL